MTSSFPALRQRAATLGIALAAEEGSYRFHPRKGASRTRPVHTRARQIVAAADRLTRHSCRRKTLPLQFTSPLGDTAEVLVSSGHPGLSARSILTSMTRLAGPGGGSHGGHPDGGHALQSLAIADAVESVLYLSVAGPGGLVESRPEVHTELVTATRGCSWTPLITRRLSEVAGFRTELRVERHCPAENSRLGSRTHRPGDHRGDWRATAAGLDDDPHWSDEEASVTSARAGTPT